jgi:hypothetical protein
LRRRQDGDDQVHGLPDRLCDTLLLLASALANIPPFAPWKMAQVTIWGFGKRIR